MISKEVFLKICDTFAETINTYKQVDLIIGYTHHTREYFNQAVKPIMRIIITDIAGEDTLASVLYEDELGKDYLHTMVMCVLEDYFDNDAQTVIVNKDGKRIHIPFGDVYTPEVIYNWLIQMDKDNPTTWNLPTGPVASGYDVIQHHISLELNLLERI